MKTKNTELDLARAIRSGDEGAFSEFYHLNCKKVKLQIWFLTGSEDLAEDIAQESFIRLWEKREMIDENKSLKAYLRRISLHLLYDHQRKMQLRRTYLNKEFSGEEAGADLVMEAVTYKELEQALSEAIEQLPPARQTMFRLSRFEDRTYAEIAESMQTTPKAVERHMAKSLRKIRQYLYKHTGVFLSLTLFAILLVI